MILTTPGRFGEEVFQRYTEVNIKICGMIKKNGIRITSLGYPEKHTR